MELGTPIISGIEEDGSLRIPYITNGGGGKQGTGQSSLEMKGLAFLHALQWARQEVF